MLKKNRYLIARRIVQLSILLLFAGGNYFGWNILKGNYSAASILGVIPMADPYSVLQIFATGFVVATDVLIGATIVLLLYSLIAGRMFCSWICPVNIISDTAAWLKRTLAIKSSFTFSRNTRYGVMVLGLVLSAILGIASFEAVSPVGMTHRLLIFGAGANLSIVVGLFLFDLAVVKNGWCGHLCPIGAFYAAVGRFSVLKVKHDQPACSNCMKCFAVCPEEQVMDIVTQESGFIHSAECTNCLRCVDVCEDNALKLSVRTQLKKT